MPRFSAEQTRILKARIDPQEPGHEVVLAALELILELGESKSEAGAIRRLLYLGAHVYLGTHVIQDATRHTTPVAQKYQKRKQSPRLKAASPAPVKSRPTETAAPGVTQSELRKTESAPESLRPAEPRVVPVAPSQMKVPEPTSQPESPAAIGAGWPSEPPPAPVAARPAGGGLMKLKTMALTKSVMPPQTSAPRPAHNSPVE